MNNEKEEYTYLNDWKSIGRSGSLSHVRGNSGEISLIQYIREYKFTINTILDSVKSDEDFNMYTLPTMFLMKHYIELILKYLNHVFESYINDKYDFNNVNKILSKKGHDLSKLYECMCKKYIIFEEKDIDGLEELKEEISLVHYDNELIKCKSFFENTNQVNFNFFKLLKEFTDLFKDLDQWDNAFKYSHDKKGNKNLEEPNQINFEVLSCNLSRIHLAVEYIAHKKPLF